MLLLHYGQHEEYGDAWENQTPVIGWTIRDNGHYMNAS